MTHEWKAYQEEAAVFFRGLGFEAKTDVTVLGARTKHAVDVLVQSNRFGFPVTWVVECKCWNTKVSKLHVLALREIVADLGADRGFLLAESGFQSGAIEAASLTNVQVTSLANVRLTADHDIQTMRLSQLNDRVLTCKGRYFDIPKETRIQYGLRQDASSGYSGGMVIQVVEIILQEAIRSIYPIRVGGMGSVAGLGLPTQFFSLGEVLAMLEPLIDDLESRLTISEGRVVG